MWFEVSGEIQPHKKGLISNPNVNWVFDLGAASKLNRWLSAGRHCLYLDKQWHPPATGGWVLKPPLDQPVLIFILWEILYFLKVKVSDVECIHTLLY